MARSDAHDVARLINDKSLPAVLVFIDADNRAVAGTTLRMARDEDIPNLGGGPLTVPVDFRHGAFLFRLVWMRDTNSHISATNHAMRQ
jgi:hypothetical protein